ncbi:MAG: SPOR domain-containing protein [Rhodoferax sp.]|nr:SPOR domain-containing protein [Rhodoferax sp.]
MAFFKFRKGGDDQVAPVPAPESVEAMRRRARHRLVGAALLVLLGVVGFPLVFDSQPRPISVDIAIEIPDKNKAKPLGNLLIPPATASSGGSTDNEVIVGTASQAAIEPKAYSPAQTTSGVQAPVLPTAAGTAPKTVASAVASGTAPATASLRKEVKPLDKTIPQSGALAPAASASTPVKTSDDGSKAQALLDGKEASPVATPSEPRLVLQIGAFSDAGKARESRMKLERAGLKTYTQVIESKEGKRIRVRVGPFTSRAEADKVAEKIRKLDLPVGMLEL